MKQLNIKQNVPGGEIRPVDCSDVNTTYDLIKKYVKDTITCCSVGELDIWVDDEGLLKSLDLNIIIKRSRTPEVTNYDTVLVGPAVFASHDEEGETISLTPAAQKILDNMKPAFVGPYVVYLIEDYR